MPTAWIKHKIIDMEWIMFKKLPIDSKIIAQMKESTPELYEELILKYGEENLINNLLVDFVVLTEDKDIVTGKDGNKIRVTKELINEVKNASNSYYQKYLKEPINALKSWIKDGDKTLGYTPIILHHNVETPRQGYVIGGSYRAISLPDEKGEDKLHLLCKGVLVNPQAKFEWLNGTLREVSPTILATNKVISELSFVNIPAQMTNTSLSAPISGDGENPSLLDEWENKIAQSKLELMEESHQNKIKQKETLAKNLTEQLLKNGVISSSQRSKIQDVFVQLSSGEETLVANVLLDIGRSPLNKKPRNVFLKGTIDMSKTKDERFLQFSKDHRHEYKLESDFIAAFDKSEANLKISLSDGQGAITDPMEEIKEKLEALRKGGALTEEHKKMLADYCGHAGVSLENSGSVGDGNVTTAGDIAIPNNTSLSAHDENEKAKRHLEMMEEGFAAAKAEAALQKQRADIAEANVLKIKQTLGVQ